MAKTEGSGPVEIGDKVASRERVVDHNSFIDTAPESDRGGEVGRHAERCRGG